MRTRLGSLITLHCIDAGVGHTFLSLNRSMLQDLDVSIVAPSCEADLRSEKFIEAVPKFLQSVCYKFPPVPKFIAEKRFISLLSGFDAAYLFPGCSQGLMATLAKSSKPVFVERINCHTGTAKRILDEAYDRLGLPPQHGITAEFAEQETEQLSMVDFVFCPSLEVVKSFEEEGLPSRKLIRSSYGWSPNRFPNLPVERSYDASKPCTFLFIGYLCVRKGTHLLLRAWEKARPNGTLVLCGNIEPAIEQTCGEILSRPDVFWHQHSPDVGRLYRQADVFVLPSLEEGSPLVTYEAMAHGLPVLVSPMGSGGIARDEIDGMVISPYDDEKWIEVLRKLSTDVSLRRHFGESARKRAEQFTWKKVGRRRAAEIIKRVDLAPCA